VEKRQPRTGWLHFQTLAHFKWEDHFSILATNSGQLQIERIDFLCALIAHEQGSIVGS